MSSNEKDLSELERALGGLQPSTAGFDRDRLMFQAGRTAAHPPRRLLWPAATGLMTAVAACLGLFMLLRANPEPTVQIVYVERSSQETPPAPVRPSPPESPEPRLAPEREGSATSGVLAMFSYWRLQEIVVRHGMDEVPETDTPGAGAPPFTAPTTAVWDWRSRPGVASSLFHSGVE